MKNDGASDQEDTSINRTPFSPAEYHVCGIFPTPEIWTDRDTFHGSKMSKLERFQCSSTRPNTQTATVLTSFSTTSLKLTDTGALIAFCSADS